MAFLNRRRSTSTSTTGRRHSTALVASARVLTRGGTRYATRKLTSPPSWQSQAWDFYDSVGELRFGANWIGNALSRVNLVAARPPASQGDDPETIDIENEDDPPTAAQARAVELVAQIADGPIGQGQMMAGFGLHLTIPGLCYLVAEPPLDDPLADEYDTWRLLSSDEVREAGDSYEIQEDENTWRLLHPNGLVVIVWRQHPRRHWQADSPTRAVLQTLREIELLDAHIISSAESRLIGRGILIFPSEAIFPSTRPESPQPDPDAAELDPIVGDGAPISDVDDFVDVLMEVTSAAKSDPRSPAAQVPVIVKIPGEYADKVTHLTFDTGFDERVLSLREAAIHRLALGIDLPPEVLTGVAGVNHWTAWQVQESAVTIHVEPTAEVACQALTDGFLAPALAAEGYDPSEAMVWYDTADLTTRPDRSEGTLAAYDRKEVSGAALRREIGLNEEDRPDEDEFRLRTLLDVAKGAPTLAPQMLALAGMLPPEVAQAVDTETPIAAPAAGGTAPVGEPAPADGAAPNGPPEMAASAMLRADSLLAAADGVAFRALERAGQRLRTVMGRSLPGGAAAIDCPDPTRLHVTIGDPTVHAPLDDLLAGSLTRVPEIADRYEVDADALTAAVDQYLRMTLAGGMDHDLGRLAHCLATADLTARSAVGA